MILFFYLTFISISGCGTIVRSIILNTYELGVSTLLFWKSFELLQILKWAHYICWFSRGITASFSSKEFLLWRSKDVFNICKLGYTTFAILEPLFWKIVKTTFNQRNWRKLILIFLVWCKSKFAQCHQSSHGLRTPNEGINQRYLKNWADGQTKYATRT